MNRIDVQAMLYHSGQIRKILFESRECRNNHCDTCGYFELCETNTVLYGLITHEANKYNVKGELKHDNN